MEEPNEPTHSSKHSDDRIMPFVTEPVIGENPSDARLLATQQDFRVRTRNQAKFQGIQSDPQEAESKAKQQELPVTRSKFKGASTPPTPLYEGAELPSQRKSKPKRQKSSPELDPLPPEEPKILAPRSPRTSTLIMKDDLQKSNSTRKKRRTNEQINKTFFCKYPGCKKAYASYVAAGLHFRNKHQTESQKPRDPDENEYTAALSSVASEATRWPVPLMEGLPQCSEWQSKFLSFQPKENTICSFIYLHHARIKAITLVNQLHEQFPFFTVLLNEILSEKLSFVQAQEKLKEVQDNEKMDVDTTADGSRVQVAEVTTAVPHFDIPINSHWLDLNGELQAEPESFDEEKPEAITAISVEDSQWSGTDDVQNYLDGDMKERHNMQFLRKFSNLKLVDEIANLRQNNPLLDFKIGYIEGFFDLEKKAINRLLNNLGEVKAANKRLFDHIGALKDQKGNLSIFQVPKHLEDASKLESLLDKRLGQALEMMLISEPICKRDVLNIWIVSPSGEYYPSFERQESLAFFCNLIPKQITAALSNWRMRHKSLVEVYDKKVFKEETPTVVRHYLSTECVKKTELFSKICSMVANISYLRNIQLDENQALDIIETILERFTAKVSTPDSDEKENLFFDLFYELSKAVLLLHVLSCHRAESFLSEYMRVVCETEPEHVPLTPLHQRLRFGEQNVIMRPADISEKSLPRKIFSHKHFSAKSVNYLKTWLKINVDDPYPTKKEYTKLAEGTGLSESQVRDWFVNARRRLIDTKPNNKDGKRKDAKRRHNDIEVAEPVSSEDLESFEETRSTKRRSELSSDEAVHKRRRDDVPEGSRSKKFKREN